MVSRVQFRIVAPERPIRVVADGAVVLMEPGGEDRVQAAGNEWRYADVGLDGSMSSIAVRGHVGLVHPRILPRPGGSNMTDAIGEAAERFIARGAGG